VTSAHRQPAPIPPAELARLRRLATLLDAAIQLPFGYRIGLDGLIGLIPGVGDGIGMALSGIIIFKAARWGVPTTTLLRMVANVLLDGVVGTLPLAGDLFDFVWRANLRNLALLESHLAATAGTTLAPQPVVVNAPPSGETPDSWP